MQLELVSIKEKIIHAEKLKPYLLQKTVGDASESGLIKFVQPILMQKFGGIYERGLISIRESHPIVRFGDGKLGFIPFSSEIKFNCIIRDANPTVADPISKDDNMTVYLKGAPDRVI